MDLKTIEAELKAATDGLLMMSETDAPFEFYHAENFRHEKLDKETVLRLAGMPAEYPFEELELGYFFRNMTQARPEAGEEGMQQANRFQHLEKKLHELLEDVKVYRVGETQKLVLILGRTSDGEIAGLKTLVVET
ncbi:nuclease A inhibitor family protein [Pontibacter sp. HSC-36F09]|uniref:nuclease A inhibitor family protein n=1 Tax=Pontibacter sp. HSC-36F09 TaxID=2910966 RepID=UPI00209D095A|nr:nuclease A inhibitor family protein [Pontibacter sp. HSC-36F09]MCP2044594.1 CRISPR/Cas system-associated exonuclease Cas4 (RecB family) [Pontibacter sp. HSC-36F09]